MFCCAQKLSPLSQMSAKIIIALATVGSGITILASLVAVGCLFNEINDLHNNVLNDMSEFKVPYNLFGSKCFMSM